MTSVQTDTVFKRAAVWPGPHPPTQQMGVRGPLPWRFGWMPGDGACRPHPCLAQGQHGVRISQQCDRREFERQAGLTGCQASSGLSAAPRVHEDRAVLMKLSLGITAQVTGGKRVGT